MKSRFSPVSRQRLRHSFAHSPEIIAIPGLISFQQASYEEFLQKNVPPAERKNVGIQAALLSFFPIQDFAGKVQLEFDSYVLEEPKYDLDEVRHKGLTYAAPLWAKLRIVVYDGAGESRVVKCTKEQDVYLGDIPCMTPNGAFVINGVERVVVSQIHRSPGVFFDSERGASSPHRHFFLARIIPFKGSWIDFEFDGKDMLCVRIDRKRKILVTTLLRALEGSEKINDDLPPAQRTGMGKEEILQTFYQHISCVRKNGKWQIPFIEHMWKNNRLTFDLVCADSGAVLGTEGEKLTQRKVNKILADGTKNILFPEERLKGKFLALDVVNEATGEVYAEAGEEISQAFLENTEDRGIHAISILDIDYVNSGSSLRDTLMADKNKDRTDALFEIYRVLRPGETPTLEGAYTLFHNLFFNPDRYDLSEVGRLKINARLGLDTDLSLRVLEKEDILAIVRYLLELKQGRGFCDDIDSLANRRVRSVGELLEGQYRFTLLRMVRNLRERLSSIPAADLENSMPNDFLSARPLSAVIREFFGLSPLSQFMDQTNPLAEVNHKRRLSALGPGGLTRDRVGIEVRDVHPTHYGKICPVETPEGPNIGLINSMAIYARINKYGFLETPYRRVVNGRLTQDIVYISALEEGRYTIGQADISTTADGTLLSDEMVNCRRAGDYVLVSAKEVDFVDVSPKQIVSAATAMIPFLSNDDPHRALMGSNMQRQGVSPIRSAAPLVGTGIEAFVAKDSGVMISAKRAGIVDQVDALRIVVRPVTFDNFEEPVVDIYTLTKFRKSNSGTCIHQKPIVKQGQLVQEGEVIADSSSTDKGELALGQNILVAFMSWNGCGFEDSIVLSKRLIIDDVFTSIHIEEFVVSALDMKLGYEEITRDIPGISSEAIQYLDEAGIVHIGAEVGPGSILVGKVSPKGETPLSPEEKLLRAIFSDRVSDMKDTSLRVPSGVHGTVVDVKVFSRRGLDKDERSMVIDRELIVHLEKDRDIERKILEQSVYNILKNMVMGKKAGESLGALKAGQVITEKEWDALSPAHYKKISVSDDKTNASITMLFKQMDKAIKELQERFDQKLEKIYRGDDLATGVLKTVKVYLAVKRRIQPGDKMAGRHGNKGVVSVVVPEEDMPFLADGTPVDMILNPLGLPSRMNVGQILETHLGWMCRGMGKKVQKFLEEAFSRNKKAEELRKTLCDVYTTAEENDRIKNMPEEELLELAMDTTHGLPVACPVFEGATIEEIEDGLKKVDVSVSGQEILYDGYTGEAFDRPITVGILYMMKLHHLVDEKIHARSVGSYSLVTQQPLGGKAQFGGQRFGEMEVWALEAYGASNTLSEMLTIKSDDLQGRTEVYKSIIQGLESFRSDIPESFNVLMKELKTLGLNVECLQNDVED